MKFFFLIFCLFSCIHIHNQNSNAKTDIASVEVSNYSKNDNVVDKYKITDSADIGRIQFEISQFKLMSNDPNLRASLGYLDLILNFKDKSYKRFEIIYTIYDGVIIQGSSNGILMDQVFKNDKLEMLILSIIPKKNN